MKRLIPIITLLFAGCEEANYSDFNGFEQGTYYAIVAKSPSGDTAKKIDALFDEIDLTFSMFNPQSLTSHINRGETDVTTPLFDECFAIARQVHALTDGYYDPTVKPLVDAWGFGPGEQQDVPCVECLMEYVGMDKIRLDGGHIIKSDPRVQLDFSSIAKGFTVDKLAALLEAEGISDYLVDVGGEMRAKGVNAAGRPWRIGISKPTSVFGGEYETVISLGGETGNGSAAAPVALATSGNYRNWFVDEAGRTRVHTIDPKTGTPAQGEILSVSILASNCAAADGWATGIMASSTVENARRLLSRTDPTAGQIEYYIMYSDGSDSSTAVFHSPGFPIDDGK